MKKLLLAIISFSAFSVFGQNVDDQKISFRYIQWPSNPLPKDIKTFEVINDISEIERINNDSVRVYESRLAKFESDYSIWLNQKRKIDKDYLLQMATYEKNLNNAAPGTTVNQPKKEAYPAPPVKEEVRLPILTDLPEDERITNAVAIDGYEKGSNGAKITIKIMGFQQARFKETKQGSGATLKYLYTAECAMPIRVILETEQSGVIVDQIVNAGISSKKLPDYTSKYEFQAWVMDNYDTFWTNRQKELLQQGLNEISNMLNERVGFPMKSYSTEIFTVKRFKDHEYEDLINAYSVAKQGFDLCYKDVDKDDAAEKLEQAVKIWESALEESFPSDKTARINEKVTALILCNLAEAYLWMDDFERATNYALRAQSAGVAKYKNTGRRLEDVINSLKSRYQVNH